MLTSKSIYLYYELNGVPGKIVYKVQYVYPYLHTMYFYDSAFFLQDIVPIRFLLESMFLDKDPLLRVVIGNVHITGDIVTIKMAPRMIRTMIDHVSLKNI